jgi:predicted MPP superfamily phosphohydrolase
LLTRRKFFNQFLVAASAVASIGCADALFLEPKNLVSEHLDIRLLRLPEEFHGFRIAQISDIHFGPYIGKGGLERALQLALSFRPDLLALIGALILPDLAKKYPVGLNQVGSLQVYTNRGLGVINPPVRFYCPPEVTFVTLFSPWSV